MKRFEQVKRLYTTIMKEYMRAPDSKLFISGITSDFDRLFELCWKTLKEYLLKEKEMSAARTGSPKDIIKLAYQQGLIEDEKYWLQLLSDRNDDAHHYNESAARSYAARIQRDYLSGIGKFIESLSKLIPEEPEILFDVPDDFIKASKAANLYYDEFLKKVMKENNCDSDLEVFKIWDTIKYQYLDDDSVQS